MRRAFVLALLAVTIAGCGSSGDGGGDAAAGDNMQMIAGPSVSDLAGATARQQQTIEFQEPDEAGDDPFTEPADIEGDETVDLPKTPFGGSGSDKVCDRDKLIRFLKKHPDRMREWARVLGIKPTYSAVSKYISKLHPVTLSRDTQVTNHYFSGGKAVPFQAILQAGTAVLVDKHGRPVARCRCGNPLTEPVYSKRALCHTCPANYTPPKQCSFYTTRARYDKEIYTRDYYSNRDYDRVFIRLAGEGPYADCWIVYPKPPTVTIIDVYREPPPEPEPEGPTDNIPPEDDPGYEPPHDGGLNCDAPSSQLEFEQCRDLQHPPAQTPEEPEGPTDYIPPEDDPGYVPPHDDGTSTNPAYPQLPDPPGHSPRPLPRSTSVASARPTS